MKYKNIKIPIYLIRFTELNNEFPESLNQWVSEINIYIY